MWWHYYSFITGLLFVVYAVLICLYRYWFVQQRPFILPHYHQPQTSFSVIVPARNEAANIGALLHSLLQQQYPSDLWEVIVIDDFSTDDTAAIVQQMSTQHPNIRLMQLSQWVQIPLNAYKKKAIELAIAQSNNEWIITTDADCTMQPQWLCYYDAYIQQRQPVLVAAPVIFSSSGSVLDTFQEIDFMTMQGVTVAAVSAGVHSMCNGANLAYQKKAFEAVNGFKGIDTIASGDDMLLMNKIKNQFPSQVGYLYAQKAIVQTAPMDTWMGFLNQRIRWASKADKYQDKSIFAVLFLMYLFNLLVFLMPFVALFANQLWLIWLGVLALKTMVEASFALPMARFFGVQLPFWCVFLQYPHISYMVLAGWLGKFGKYQWKGRQVT